MNQALAQSIQHTLDALQAGGYTCEVERRWDDKSYTYPAPTAVGLQRLQEGRLFGSESSAVEQRR